MTQTTNILDDLRVRLLIADAYAIDPQDLDVLQRVVFAGLSPALHTKIDQLQTGYPLDYLLSQVIISGLTLSFTSDVFIVRPETQYWINLVFHKYKSSFAATNTIVDLCTGSGFISLKAAQAFGNTKNIIAGDISEKTLTVAQANAVKNNINCVQFVQSDGLKNIYPHISKPWILLCNPPYVPTEFEPSVQFEPALAIYSGDDGLDFFRKLLTQLDRNNLPTHAFFELDPRNISTADKLVINTFATVKTIVFNDQNNLARVLIVIF